MLVFDYGPFVYRALSIGMSKLLNLNLHPLEVVDRVISKGAKIVQIWQNKSSTKQKTW